MDIPIKNIYYLLSYAWNKLEEGERINAAQMECETLIDLLASVLANGAAYVLRRGLDRGYVPYLEETATLRGKIDAATTLKRTYFAAPRIFCEYDEFQHNILQNQILKTTMFNVLRLPELHRDIRGRLEQCYRKLTNIDRPTLTKRHFGLVQLHRNNGFYDLLLDVCQLIHENLFVDEQSGAATFNDFVRDEKKMAALFEAFVRNFYKREQQQFKVEREYIEWDAEPLNDDSHDLLPKMQTDISLTSSDRKIIIDTKYYKEALQTHYDKQTIISSNLYQIHAYLTNLEALGGVNVHCEGILLYPTATQELNIQRKIKGHRVSVRTIDLSQEWPIIKQRLLEAVFKVHATGISREVNRSVKALL
ncbi:McrC protein [Candidatus Vecturithrix granuli]|uniref:McrC protein n=1 Tax=Vecturithrix granuli TaxID=1499967 RepID=A0A081BXC7_VECG1|nr:McrC protein [Candidatus Vecturithrix granuli]